jgi:RES domain-containing protein
VKIWRICKAKHRETAFSGDGGLYAAGRWTPQGIRVVYTSESLALATLEVFVHTESNVFPLISIRASLEDNTSVEEIKIDDLPSTWQEESAYPSLQAIGEDWLRSNRTAILKVPSVIIPFEYNYILNPKHPEFKISTDSSYDFKFDRRMWKRVNS